MSSFNRRTFLTRGTAAGVLTSLDVRTAFTGAANEAIRPFPEDGAAIDFRFSPADFQSTICFPDDPEKTVIGKHGDLRYDFPSDIFAAIDEFGTIVEFSLAGLGEDTWT